MPSSLTAAECRAYQRDGFLAPIDVFGAGEVARLRRCFEDFEAKLGPERALAMRTDLHLVQRWAWEVVTDPRIVGPVTDVLGPDVLLWSCNWFIKEPGDGKHVSFHQDATYWGLEPHDVTTAWLALSDASVAAGAMAFVPGSHRGALLEHEETHAPDNLLTRGQRIRGRIGETVFAPLHAGQMSLHHVRAVHGSGPNTTAERRIGMVLRYCATHVRQTRLRDTAVLVAGEDRYGHFDLLDPPEVDFGDEERRRQADSVRRLTTAIMSS